MVTAARVPGFGDLSVAPSYRAEHESEGFDGASRVTDCA
jgi:hypothetical protein